MFSLFNAHCQHYLSSSQSRHCQACIFKVDSETHLFVPVRSEGKVYSVKGEERQNFCIFECININKTYSSGYCLKKKNHLKKEKKIIQQCVKDQFAFDVLLEPDCSR